MMFLNYLGLLHRGPPFIDSLQGLGSTVQIVQEGRDQTIENTASPRTTTGSPHSHIHTYSQTAGDQTKQIPMPNKT